MRFVKLMLNSFEIASRNKRELSVVRQFTSDIIVVTRGNEDEKCSIDGYEVHKLATRPLGSICRMVKLNRFISLFTWAGYVRRLRADYISCHGLIALMIGWMSSLGKVKKRPDLIYDSHEFEPGVNLRNKKNGISNRVKKLAEKFLIRKSAVTIVVSESIADRLQKIYSLPDRPLVVRNIPEYCSVDPIVCREKPLI